MVKVAKKANTLPSGTTIDNIIKLMEIFKRKNNDKDAKPMFGKGGSAYSNTKSALRSFGLIEDKDCKFTKYGLIVAHSTEVQKKEIMLDILLKFLPYESLLDVVFSESEVSETDLTFITNHWGRFEFGSTQRNREDGANLFGNFIEFTGLGKYVIGRGKNVTRIVWDGNAKQIYTEALNKLSSQQPEDITQKDLEEAEVPITQLESELIENMEEITQTAISEENEKNEENEENEESEKVVSIVNRPISGIKIAPNININVDMSDWEEEKIKGFFKYAYGIFEEEQ